MSIIVQTKFMSEIKKEATNTTESSEVKQEPIILGGSDAKPEPVATPVEKVEETPVSSSGSEKAEEESADGEEKGKSSTTAFILGVIIGAFLTALFI